jgi:hypothetical protein
MYQFGSVHESIPLWTATKRPFAIWLVGLAILVSGCGLMSNSNADDRDPVDIKLLRALQEGWPADPSMYEVKDIECIRYDDRVEMQAVLVNRSDVNWAFSPQFVVETTGGEVLAQRKIGDFLDPGQEVTYYDFYLGTDFHDPPRCTVKVFHDDFLAMQDEDNMAEIYEVLDWKP